MFCRHCGKENDSNAFKCTQCGKVIQTLPAAPSLQPGTVPTNLVWAIIATLLCCLPTGIVAIVYAAQVDGKLAAGDLNGARQSSSNAATWSWVSFGIGLLVSVGYLLLIIASAAGQ